MIAVAIVAVVSLLDPIHLIAVALLGFGIRSWPWAAAAGAAAGFVSALVFYDASSPMAAAILMGRPLGLGAAAGLISWAVGLWRSRRRPPPARQGIDALAALRKRDKDAD